LTIDDIVRIKALIPDSVNFDYVDKGQLDVDAESVPPRVIAKQDDDIYRLAQTSISALSSVLYFEFTDGELKPKLNRNKG
jgi:hypothetical protein